MLAALGLLGYRFAHVDLAPFARDEPQFLAARPEQLQTGHWLSANPLYGNLGLRYGATAFWFYGVEQALLGPDPRVAIVAMGLTVTLAHLALAFALWRLFGGGPVFLAVLVAWVASSPYQFLWSRLAWDLTSNAAVFAAAALLCTYRELGVGRALALGTVIGLGISTHPMLVPFAVAAFVVVGRGAVASRPLGAPRGGGARGLRLPRERSLSPLPDARADRPPVPTAAPLARQLRIALPSGAAPDHDLGASVLLRRAPGRTSACGWAKPRM